MARHEDWTKPARDIQEAIPTRKEILYEGYFYDVFDWMKRHPGGKVIAYYTECGEDATMAIQQFHKRSTKRIMTIMKSLKRRPATDKELGLTSATLKRHQALTDDFTKLYQELDKIGFFKPSPPHIAYRLLELVGLAAAGIYLMQQNCFASVFLGIISFALFQGRCGWLQHECGHYSLTGNTSVDRMIQAVLYGVGDGMSSSWWTSQHNRHHAMPQRIKRDVDLETLPLLAFNVQTVKNPKQGRTFFVQNQALLFLAIDTLLVATMWKIYLHPIYVIQKKKYHELVLMIVHYTFAYYIGFLPYVTSVWLASIYTFGNFSLSHSHLPVTEGPIHYVEYAFLHTLDIEKSWWCDWWMAYLNYQIEHHLFPTMPQFRLSLIQDRVRSLAMKHNLPYSCKSYGEAVKLTYTNLVQVSQHLAQA